MSPAQKAAEISFNKRYSRFKVMVFFPNRPPITHYGTERIQCTVAQIVAGHIKQFVIHRDHGLKDCIARIDLCEKLYGRYTTAVIYDNKYKTSMPDGSLQKGREIIKYVCGKKIEFVEEEKIFSEHPRKINVHCILSADKKITILPIQLEQKKKESVVYAPVVDQYPDLTMKEVYEGIHRITKELSIKM